MNSTVLYTIGAGLIGTGVMLVYLAGTQDGRKDQEAETWHDANDSEMGPMGDVRGKRHGVHSVGDSA